MPRVEAAYNRAATAHERAATTHERAALYFDRIGKGEVADRERRRARSDREGASADRERSRLRREWKRSRSCERAEELGEDGQVGVKLHPLNPTDSQRQ